MAAIIPLAAALAPAAPLALAALLGRYLLTLGAIRTALPAWAGRLVVAAPGVLAAPAWAVWLGAGAWLVAGQGVAGLLLGHRRWLPWLRTARAAWLRRR